MSITCVARQSSSALRWSDYLGRPRCLSTRSKRDLSSLRGPASPFCQSIPPPISTRPRGWRQSPWSTMVRSPPRAPARRRESEREFTLVNHGVFPGHVLASRCRRHSLPIYRPSMTASSPWSTTAVAVRCRVRGRDSPWSTSLASSRRSPLSRSARGNVAWHRLAHVRDTG